MNMFVLLANVETSVNFTGNLIPFIASSYSCSHCLYFVTHCGPLSAGCKADRIGQRKHLLSSFYTFIIAFLFAKTFGKGMHDAPLREINVYINKMNTELLKFLNETSPETLVEWYNFTQ